MESNEKAPLSLPDDLTALKLIVCELQAEIAALRSENVGLRDEVAFLLERLRLQLIRRFASSRDALPNNQPDLFNEAELAAVEPEEAPVEIAPEEAPTEVSTQSPGKVRAKTGGRKPLPENLPRVELLHDLIDAEKLCSCGGQMNRIGEETSEQLDIIPVKIQVLRHIRPKYACSACLNKSPTPEASAKVNDTAAEGAADASAVRPKKIVTAPLPPQPIPKSNASPRMLAWILTCKFLDSLPLYRQQQMLLRFGVEISRATLANWMIAIGLLIQPLIEQMRQEMLGYNILNMDETTVQVLKEENKRPTAKSWMWVQRGGPPGRRVVLFHYAESRCASEAEKLLDGYSGYLQSDGFSSYNAVGKYRPEIRQIGCFAHARRKFTDAIKARGKGASSEGHAEKGAHFIGQLYAIEREIHDKTPEERKQVRLEKAKPVLEKMEKWLKQTRPQVSRESYTGKALGYLHNQWPKLVGYLEDGRLEIDNNAAERAIRPFAIGRKNWLFCDTPKGARASANIYSLIQTAKANGHEPWHYLAYLLQHLPAATTPEQQRALLPYNLPPELTRIE